jgi:hypothetical protein
VLGIWCFHSVANILLPFRAQFIFKRQYRDFEFRNPMDIDDKFLLYRTVSQAGKNWGLSDGLSGHNNGLNSE